MFDVAVVEILVPVSDQFIRQKIRLVDQQHIFLVAFTDILNVFLQIWGIEKLGISCIDNLDEYIRFLDDTP